MTSAQWEDREQERWIVLQGELDHDGCEQIKMSFQEAAEDVGPQRVVVDMGKVSFVSSQGIWMLLQAHSQLKNAGRAMVVKGLQPHVHKVFDTVGVFRAIPEWEA